ncbi:uncharacterized protein LOC126665600 [Mercurialis annua]|uniref:uncharacterized protein LOC126665600 n=1 Tax=Mercurialis annua TaxID=3986 RepID=UPI00215FFF99|nr:uncharacterized protein LOC126665600 [Mercurialis annua]
MATTLPLQQQPPYFYALLKPRRPIALRHVATVRAFQRGDFDRFARNTWRSANDGFEQLLYEARKAAERIDRRYSVTRRVGDVAQSAADRAREIDRELEIGVRWRSFTVDFSRNLPRYRRELSGFLDTPLGRGVATIFFLWFAFSGWLFRFLIFATWVLPFAAPLLIGTVANNLVIKGACPACKRQFVGYKNQVIRCAGCGNIVWQPDSRGGRGSGRGGTSSSKSDPNIIDVEFEEK